MTNNIALLQTLSIFDIYNYLASFNEFKHSTFRNKDQMESFSLAVDDCRTDVKIAAFVNDAVNRSWEREKSHSFHVFSVLYLMSLLHFPDAHLCFILTLT